MTAEPLKEKEIVSGIGAFRTAFYADDVSSAVRWLKEGLKDFNLLAQTDLDKNSKAFKEGYKNAIHAALNRIDEAFADVTEAKK